MNDTLTAQDRVALMQELRLCEERSAMLFLKLHEDEPPEGIGSKLGEEADAWDHRAGGICETLGIRRAWTVRSQYEWAKDCSEMAALRKAAGETP